MTWVSSIVTSGPGFYPLAKARDGYFVPFIRVYTEFNEWGDLFPRGSIGNENYTGFYHDGSTGSLALAIRCLCSVQLDSGGYLSRDVLTGYTPSVLSASRLVLVSAV